VNPEDLIGEQVDYYRARAPEYDQWWLRDGRYDLGAEFNARWRDEVGELEARLDAFAPSGDVLELAAGTGLWTRQLVRHASTLTCLDASPETLAINRSRTQGAGAPVEYVEADLFSWWPPRRYDVVFFSFWLSHVPPSRFDWFWSMVAAAVVPGGRVMFFDNAAPFEAIVPEFPLLQEDGEVRPPWVSSQVTDAINHRRLEDGRTFNVIKVFYDPAELRGRLESMGWSASVATTPTFFLHGTATRT
jgi:demethylmenaquinone methyltransferase/2-methoxy-6-polyprenyl-1,4-benzoquinol methylase